MVTLPAFFPSLVAMLARLSKTFDTADLFNSLASARACASWPLDIGLAPAFMAFIAGGEEGRQGHHPRTLHDQNANEAGDQGWQAGGVRQGRHGEGHAGQDNCQGIRSGRAEEI